MGSGPAAGGSMVKGSSSSSSWFSLLWSVHLLIQVIVWVDIVLLIRNAAWYHEEEEQWLDHNNYGRWW